MGLLDRFKKNTDKKEDKKVKQPKQAKQQKEEKKDNAKKEGYSSLKSKTDPGLQPVPAKEGAKVKRTKKQDTKDAYKVLIRPLITEKATELVSQNKYAFEVSKNTNKVEIKKAMKALYGVDALDVNIVNMRGKKVRSGRITGKKKNWKKAIITLKPGDKIEIYEGV